MAIHIDKVKLLDLNYGKVSIDHDYGGSQITTMGMKVIRLIVDILIVLFILTLSHTLKLLTMLL